MIAAELRLSEEQLRGELSELVSHLLLHPSATSVAKLAREALAETIGPAHPFGQRYEWISLEAARRAHACVRRKTSERNRSDRLDKMLEFQKCCTAREGAVLSTGKGAPSRSADRDGLGRTVGEGVGNED
jgi:hypothetical protein